MVAQPEDELEQERIGERPLIEALCAGQGQLGFRSARSEKLVGQLVRTAAFVAAEDDAFGDAPQILDEDNPQGDRRGPELADRQRLHFLIGVHEAAPHIDVEPAVRVRNEGPGHPEDARKAGERSICEFRQLAVVARRKVRSDLPDLPLHLVEIVDQPLGRRGDGGVLSDRAANGFVSGDQAHFVVGEPIQQRMAPQSPGLDSLSGGQAARVLLQTLDAEQHLADGVRIIPERRWGFEPECMAKRGGHGDLSAAPHRRHVAG